MTSGNEDGSEDEGGSDSEPSEDNLEEEELAKIIPIATKVKPEPPKKEEPTKVSTAKGKKAEPPKRPSRSGFVGEEKSGSS